MWWTLLRVSQCCVLWYCAYWYGEGQVWLTIVPNYTIVVQIPVLNWEYCSTFVETDLFDSIIVLLCCCCCCCCCCDHCHCPCHCYGFCCCRAYVYYAILHKTGINAKLVVASLPACSQCIVVNCVFIYIYIYIYVCVCVCVFVCIHVCKYEWMFNLSSCQKYVADLIFF